MKRILVATDGSSASAAAEEAAVELCVENDAELVVVHCWRAPGDWLGEPYYNRAVARELAAARGVLDRPLALAKEAGVAATAELVEASAAEGVLDVAKSHDCDFVVVGAHDRGPVERVVMGSVSRAVIRHAKVPVLVVNEHTLLQVREQARAAS